MHQAKLQYLGLYTTGQVNMSRIVEHLPRQLTLPCPMVFGMGRGSFQQHLNHLVIFPTFYNSPSTIGQTCADLYDQGVARGVLDARKEWVSRVSVYFSDLSDMTLVRNVIAEGINSSFPHVTTLHIYLKHPSQVVSQANASSSQHNGTQMPAYTAPSRIRKNILIHSRTSWSVFSYVG